MAGFQALPELKIESADRPMSWGRIVATQYNRAVSSKHRPFGRMSMIGKTISHYKIQSKLGEGGMGEVYLAEDTELGRRVALKVLPAEMAERSGASRTVFRREAKAVAALNHPNIVTIYSIETGSAEETGEDEVRFLTMELVEGESLDKVVPPGGLPLTRVFEIAVPLADAPGSGTRAGHRAS